MSPPANHIESKHSDHQNAKNRLFSTFIGFVGAVAFGLQAAPAATTSIDLEALGIDHDFSFDQPPLPDFIAKDWPGYWRGWQWEYLDIQGTTIENTPGRNKNTALRHQIYYSSVEGMPAIYEGRFFYAALTFQGFEGEPTSTTVASLDINERYSFEITVGRRGYGSTNGLYSVGFRTADGVNLGTFTQVEVPVDELSAVGMNVRYTLDVNAEAAEHIGKEVHMVIIAENPALPGTSEGFGTHGFGVAIDSPRISVETIPEPSPATLLGLSGLTALLVRKRRTSAHL